MVDTARHSLIGIQMGRLGTVGTKPTALFQWLGSDMIVVGAVTASGKSKGTLPQGMVRADHAHCEEPCWLGRVEALAFVTDSCMQASLQAILGAFHTLNCLCSSERPFEASIEELPLHADHVRYKVYA